MKEQKIEQLVADIRELFELRKSYVHNIELLKYRRQLVIYGFGRVGRRLLEKIQNDVNVVALCDNGIEIKEFFGLPVFSHEACVRQFPNATYIITSQKDFLKIAVALRRSGISKDEILFYNNTKNCLEGNLYQSIRNNSDFAFFSEIKNVVLYGLGSVGKSIFDSLSIYKDFSFFAICDNGCEYTEYKGVPLFKHDECLRKCKDAAYLITPQKEYLEIMFRLLDDGVEPKKIMFFNKAKNIVEVAG